MATGKQKPNLVIYIACTCHSTSEYDKAKEQKKKQLRSQKHLGTRRKQKFHDHISYAVNLLCLYVMVAVVVVVEEIRK